MITMKELAGEWELESFTIEKNHKIQNPWGENSHGILIYTTSGYMSVSINSEIENAHPTVEEKYKSILFYSGKYEITNGNRITHYVMNASDTNRINKELLREAHMDNDKLTLIGNGDFGIASLIWKKTIHKPLPTN